MERRLKAQQAAGGGRGGSSGGRPPNLNGILGGTAGMLLLIGGSIAVSQSLFNVDGGHRAVKYSRLTGVKPDIYNEGTHFMVSVCDATSERSSQHEAA